MLDATDFQTWLNIVGVTNFLCRVPGSGHGQGYLFDSGCGGPPPPTVFDQTESFFHPYLWT